jgi:hypothetical protein
MDTINRAVGNFLEVTWRRVPLLGLPKGSNSLKKLKPIRVALNQVFKSVRRDRPDLNLDDSWESVPHMQSLMSGVVSSLFLSYLQIQARFLLVAGFACIEFPDERVEEPFAILDGIFYQNHFVDAMRVWREFVSLSKTEVNPTLMRKRENATTNVVSALIVALAGQSADGNSAKGDDRRAFQEMGTMLPGFSVGVAMFDPISQTAGS